jgi:hypothetical protein
MKRAYWRSTLLLFFLHLLNLGQAQTPTENPNIRLESKRMKVGAILEAIEKQSDYAFVYKTAELELEEEQELEKELYPLDELLALLFPRTDYKVEKLNQSIILKRLKKNTTRTSFTISGYVSDQKSGEAIIGAAIVVPETYRGTSSNDYGFYSLTVLEGVKEIQVSSIGYQTRRILLGSMQDQSLNIALEEAVVAIKEVEVSAEDPSLDVNAIEVNTRRLSAAELKKVPTLLGEADLMKVVQLMPSVSSKGEGATNFNVRGGTAGQNLILLDEATVYNPSHLMGFFSVFNPDAINGLTFYRNDFPANYGGRLSSVLDIQMKEGNKEKFSVSGGIGTISSRLLLEGPLVKDKSSFLFSGRRTYADMFFLLSGDESIRKSKLYFYDFNLKTNYKIDDKNSLFLSGYFGKDAIKISSLNYHILWGNATGTIRWNHVFNSKLFSNTSLIYSNYNYEIDFPRTNNPVSWEAGITDFKTKVDFSYYPNAQNTVRFGFESSLKTINPGRPLDPQSLYKEVPQAKTNLNTLYLSNEQKLGRKLSLRYGLRFNQYNLLAPYEELSFEGDSTASKKHRSGIVTSDYAIEPRFGASYLLGENTSIKLNYSRTLQYLHLLSNSVTSFSALDIWYPSNNNIRPERSNNYSLGMVRMFANKNYRFSSEIYYRDLYKQLDYADHSLLTMNRNIEKLLRAGQGEAYGLEVSLDKNKGRLRGTLSYTFSRVFYQIKEINQGKRYPAPHDQPHRVNISANYQLSERCILSTNWVYSSGYATTLPKETFVYGDYVVPIYGEKNSERIPDYHRLDLSLSLKQREKAGRKKEGTWVFSIYNAYGRLNPLTVFVGPKMKDINIIEDENRIAYQKLSLFSVLPSVSYNFKF